jgi:outer membrane protein
MSRKKNLFTALLFTLAILPMHAQEYWDWNQCLDQALSNNIQLKLNEINVALSDIQQRQNKLAFTPSIGLTGSGSYALGRTVDVTTFQFVTQPVQAGQIQFNISQPLFEGLRNIHAYKAAQLDFRAARLDNDALKEDISLQVMNAYLNVLNAEEQYEQAKNQLMRSKEQYGIQKNLVESGAMAERMLVDLDAQVANDTYNEILLQQQVALAYMALKTILQLDQNKELKLVTPEIMEPLSIEPLPMVTDVFRDAMGIRPEIRSGQLRVESARKNIQVAKGAYLPSLNLFSASQTNVSDRFSERKFSDTILAPIGFVAGTGESVVTFLPQSTIEKVPIAAQFGNNFTFNVGISLSVPIYNKRAFYFNTQRSRLALAQAELNLKGLEYNLFNSIKEAHIRASGSAENYKAAQKNRAAAELSYSFALERAANGDISQLEVNLTQSNLFIAQSRATQAKFEYLFNLKVLDFYRGKTINFE